MTNSNNQMRRETFDAVDKARAYLDANGGWLIKIGHTFAVISNRTALHWHRDGTFGVRSKDYARACAMLECWDETAQPDEVPQHIAIMMDDVIREDLHSNLTDEALPPIFFLAHYLQHHREAFEDEEFHWLFIERL
tara:strand:+ start:9511 stop:9918 length:408 start_codon:yes stop_codon:yes gene_type:complete